MQRAPMSLADRLALALSAAMTPAVTATATTALVAWRFESGRRAAALFCVMALFGTVFGMALAVARARRKGLRNLHIHERADRPGFFGVCAAAAAVGWGVLLAAGAPTALLVFMGAYGACLGVIALTTLAAKPSVHCAAMAALTGALGVVRAALPFVLLAAVGLAALAWARVHRKRHTPLECLFGVLIGAAAVAVGMLVWKWLEA
jgi:hypothetical protein